MRSTTVTGLAVLFAAFCICPLAHSDEIVTPADVTVVKVLSPSGDGNYTNVTCFESEPGSLRSKDGSLSFKTLSATIRRLRAVGNSKKLKRTILLRKRGRTACAEGSPLSMSAAATDSSASLTLGLGNSGELGIPLDSLGGSVLSSSTLTDILAALQTAFSCANLTLGAASVSVDFGSGCTINGTTFSGSAIATASLNDGSISVTFSFTNLSANGFTLNGTAAFTLQQGSLAVQLDFDSTQSTNTTSLEFTGTVLDDETGFTVNGSGEFSNASVSGEFTISDLHIVQDGSCYPNSGTVVIELDNAPAITVTFSESSVTAGEVTVQIGSVSSVETLPACGA